MVVVVMGVVLFLRITCSSYVQGSAALNSSLASSLIYPSLLAKVRTCPLSKWRNSHIEREVLPSAVLLLVSHTKGELKH